MYLLTDKLPTSVSVNGTPFEISTDFRLFVDFERRASSGAWDAEWFTLLLYSFYKGKLPSDINAAQNAFLDFYTGARFVPSDASGKKNYVESKSDAIPYDYGVDDHRIFTAFYEAYRIDLSRENLHWYIFLALLDGIMPCKFSDIVGFRTADYSKLDRSAQKEMRRVQRAYRIVRDVGKEGDIVDAWAEKMQKLLYEDSKKKGGD